jgi:hypothetical protein
MSIRSEVEAALAGSQPIVCTDYLRWTRADDLAVKAGAYRLSAVAWVRITPAPTRDEQCGFMADYLLGCIAADRSADDFVHSGFAAGYELAAWLKHLATMPGTELVISRGAESLAELFKASDDATRNRIETAALEHALELPALRPFFTAWASDPVLAGAFSEPLSQVIFWPANRSSESAGNGPPSARQPSRGIRAKVGGRREDRTRDLRIANAALSQLS